MEDAVDSSRETQPTFGSAASSPPPYSAEGQQPPPYSVHPAPGALTTGKDQLVTGYESFTDIRQEDLSDTTPLLSSSSFDDRTVRRGFVRKVFPPLSHLNQSN